MTLNNNELNTPLDNEILNYDGVREYLMEIKKNKVLEQHRFAITEPSSENGRWQTMFIDTEGKRRCIKAKTKDALIDKLVDLYSDSSYKKNLTFHQLFNEWVDYKTQITSSPNTIKRYKQIYNKYFTDSILHTKKVNAITDIELEVELNRIIKDFSLTRKAWVNAKTILNGMFRYAMRKEYIKYNPLLNIEITVKYKQAVRKTGKTEIYNTDELQLLNEYLDSRLAEQFDSAVIAIKLNFLLGLRVGELVALKWEDIEGNKIHVVREEIRNQETGAIEVVEHTKTNRDRQVYLVSKAIRLLNEIPRESEYIFTRKGERVRARQIAYLLEKFAKKHDLRTKSSHKMRKTYASVLNANGVPLDTIRIMLGHSSLGMTLQYLYDPLTESESFDLIEKAL